MRFRVLATVAALVTSLIAGAPAGALDASGCSSTHKDFSLAGFDYLCDFQLLDSSIESSRNKVIYRPAYDDYVFFAKSPRSGNTMGLYSSSLTPGSTYTLLDRLVQTEGSPIYRKVDGKDSIVWFRTNYFGDVWSLSDYQVGRTSNPSGVIGYSKTLNGEVYYWTQANRSLALPMVVTLQSGERFEFDYDPDYLNVPQIALSQTSGVSYAGWVVVRTDTANKIVAYGFADPSARSVGGTEVLSYPTSTKIFGIDYDGSTFSMLVLTNGLVQLRMIDKFGTVTTGASTPKLGTITNMVATPAGTYVEFALNAAATSRKLVFLPKQIGLGRVVNEDVEWSISPLGKAAWVEQGAAGGYVVKEFSPSTLATSTTAKLPFPALSEPTLSYLRDERLLISASGVGMFIGRPTGQSAAPVLETAGLQSWYDPTSTIEIAGTDLQSIADLDCTTAEGNCQLVMDEATNRYKLQLALNNAPVGDATMSLAFQTSDSQSVTKSFSYKVRNPISASLAAATITAGDEIAVSGVSLDLISSVSFGPSAVTFNPSVAFDKTSNSIRLATDEALESGTYTVKLFHPDKRGASYPFQSISLDVTVSASNVPTFATITGNIDPLPGDQVRITGTALTEVTAVKVNGQNINVDQSTDTRLSFSAPALTAGNYPITAVTANGDLVTGLAISIGTTPEIVEISGHQGVEAGALVTLRGNDLELLTSVTVGGIAVSPATVTNGSTWTFRVPAGLAEGPHEVVATWGGGQIDTGFSVSVATAGSAPVVVNPTDLEFSVWTKKISETEIKMYAKNPIGAGKVVFKVNGEEYAWVRATSINDRKLRVIADGPMAGVSYLVRTITLQPGKNALEFYLEGERIRRNTYSLR